MKTVRKPKPKYRPDRKAHRGNRKAGNRNRKARNSNPTNWGEAFALKVAAKEYSATVYPYPTGMSDRERIEIDAKRRALRRSLTAG